ncbi:MAG: hypothetical protein Q9195_005288 [Heterodermia aff. obscurata]
MASVIRRDLATPKGIDHDYNYLTSIERQLDNAEREATGRGFLLQDERPGWRQQGLDGPKKGEIPMKAAIEKCGAIVERAPEGMARQKQNATLWDRKKHRLIWTVEWIQDDGHRECGQCSEFDTLSAAFTAHTQSKKPKEASNHGDEASRKRKRKRRTGCNASSPTTGPSSTHDPMVTAPADESPTKTGSTAPEQSWSSDLKDAAPAERNNLHRNSKLESQNLDSLITEGASTEAISNDISLLKSDDAGQQQRPLPNHPDEPSVEAMASERLVHSLHFYLHVPRVPSPQPVLIPLPPDSTLFTCLRNRLVLEFPTIYVLPYPKSELPASYLTEEVFDKRMQQESFRESVMAKLTGNEEGEIEEPIKQEENIDTRKIQEVLQRDVKCLQ